MLRRPIATVPVPPRAAEQSERCEDVERLAPAVLHDQQRHDRADRCLPEHQADAQYRVRKCPAPFRKPVGKRTRGDRKQRRVGRAEHQTDDEERHHRARSGRSHERGNEAGEEREHAPGQGDVRQRAARAVDLSEDAAGNLQQRVAEVEAAEDPAELDVGEAEFFLDARNRDRQVIAQQVVDEAQHEQHAQDPVTHRDRARAAHAFVALRRSRSRSRSDRMRCAALNPGAPVTPPPGCVPAPHRYSARIGVA